MTSREMAICGVTYCASGKVSASMTLTHRCVQLVYDHAMVIVPHPDGEDHRIRKWLGT
jgi:hypothetical protein